ILASSACSLLNRLTTWRVSTLTTGVDVEATWTSATAKEVVMKANIRTLMAAVTLAAGLAAAPMALGQADLQRQQLEKQEQERKREQRAANQETRAERREAKHEREELNNMPKRSEEHTSELQSRVDLV